MTPDELSRALSAALHAAVADGSLALPADAVPASVHVERPRQREHGDWSTNVAMQLGKRAGTTPRALAEDLAARLVATPGVARADVAGPGFLNITLDVAAAAELARTIVRSGTAYGRGTPRRASTSTSSSSRPTRRDRSTSAASGGPPSATRSHGCWRRRARA
ncbi:hypothetical protein GCM10025865_22440 [Paraoerskovia sediminicola]|uniref:Arginyl tRNA synthetase N-terminal domain-containing protein n=1 Tax=Paraoerskovia sediminicola TaxID=1138587 RepID=A0ABM8G4G9_9CELL|nr:hypothetical protein GCM10025865_22440 [Paraoerskovia sediminicola]